LERCLARRDISMPDERCFVSHKRFATDIGARDVLDLPFFTARLNARGYLAMPPT
jgi:hypothetical protein